MKYIAICLIICYVCLETALSQSSGGLCMGFGGSCDSYSCCNGLECVIQADGEEICTSSWLSKLKGKLPLKNDARLFVPQKNGNLQDPCTGRGNSCAAKPYNCCDSMTCVMDAFDNWTCQHLNN